MRVPSRLRITTIVCAVVLAALACAWTTPAFASGTATIEGHVTDAVSHAPLRGIAVDIWSSGGYHLTTVFTDASGHYTWTVSFVDPSLTDRVTFSDLSKTYGPKAWGGGVNMLMGSDIPLVDGTDAIADAAMQKAVTFRSIVTRTGHPYTMLPGMLVEFTWDAYPINAYYTGSSSGGGVSVLAGAAPGTWSFGAADPARRFDDGLSSASGQTFAAGGSATIQIQMPLLLAAQDVAVSVPSAKPSQKAGKAFSAIGTLSKRVTATKSVTILALKGSTRKTFSAKVSAKAAFSTYKATVKLSRGTWTIVALFSGTGALAPTDSATGRSITVK